MESGHLFFQFFNPCFFLEYVIGASGLKIRLKSKTPGPHPFCASFANLRDMHKTGLKYIFSNLVNVFCEPDYVREKKIYPYANNNCYYYFLLKK